MQRFLNTLSAHKQVVAPPLVLLVLVVGLCVFGVLHATDAVIATQRQLSKSTAEWVCVTSFCQCSAT